MGEFPAAKVDETVRRNRENQLLSVSVLLHNGYKSSQSPRIGKRIKKKRVMITWTPKVFVRKEKRNRTQNTFDPMLQVSKS